jgi:hypothetical protein
MPESSAIGVAKDLCQICQAGESVIVAFRREGLDQVVRSATQVRRQVGNAESVVTSTLKMMAKFETLETGNVGVLYHLSLNRNAKQAQEKVDVQGQMMVPVGKV